ncbi:MAG TPA: hypothetical protein VGC45_11760 [Gryllotalpicola sp.]
MESSDAIRMLLAAGMRVTPIDRAHFRSDDGRIIVRSRLTRRPTPANVRSELSRLNASEFILFAVDSTTASLVDAARSDHRIVLASGSDNAVWLDGERIDVGDVVRHTPAWTGRGPKPYVRFALLRALLTEARPLTQLRLSEMTGVSQPAVSYALRGLDRFVQKASRSWILGNPAKAFDYACDAYPGTGGIDTYWWSDAPLEEQVGRAVGDIGHLVSGDLAARAINAWRIPEHATVYSRTGVDLSERGFAAGTPADYTLALTVPDDQTIWSTAGQGAIADPVIAAWDVKRTGTTGDQDEAADMIRKKVLRTFSEGVARR